MIPQAFDGGPQSLTQRITPPVRTAVQPRAAANEFAAIHNREVVRHEKSGTAFDDAAPRKMRRVGIEPTT